MYGTLFTSSYGVEVDQDGAWFKCLRDLAPTDLGRGLERLVLSGGKWPPTAPEFRAACITSPDDLGLPNAGQAYIAICEMLNTGGAKDWGKVHPAIYDAYLRLDAFRFKNCAGNQHQQMFRAAYSITVERVQAGYKLPEIPKLIEESSQGEAPESKSERMSALKRLREKLGL